MNCADFAANESICPLCSALAEVEKWQKKYRTDCIIEIACENQSVSDFMEHWEGRALKAEAYLDTWCTDRQDPRRPKESK